MHAAARFRRRTVVAITFALTATLALALVASAGAAKKPVKGPAGAKFYTPPTDTPSKHGKLIWQRKAGGVSPIDGAASDTLVLYSSTTPAGDPTAVSGVVSVPEGKPPRKGWPVISYAHGTTGTADVCAPSRVSPGSPVAAGVDYIDPELEDWIDAGYAVVQTDYQGLGTPGPHEYLIRTAEGRGVVDIVAAARQLDPDIGKGYLLAGHSQGGHAALSAAGIAEKWGKGLKLRGTVAFAPASHVADQASLLPALTAPSPLSALVALIVEGAASFSSQVQVPQILADEPLALFPEVRTKCVGQLAEMSSFGGIAPADLVRDGANLEPLLGVLRAQNPAVKTRAPILIAQGTADTTVFKQFTDLLADELVKLGDEVDYEIYEGVNHGDIPSAAGPAALDFYMRELPPRK